MDEINLMEFVAPSGRRGGRVMRCARLTRRPQVEIAALNAWECKRFDARTAIAMSVAISAGEFSL